MTGNVDVRRPEREQAGDDDRLHDDAGQARLEDIGEEAVDDAQRRAGEHRRRDHQALLAGVEMQVLGDEDRQRSEHHPDHEADIEIEKGGDERGQMARAEETPVHWR